MNADSAGVKLQTKFWYLSKYEGDRGARPQATGNDDKDLLDSIRADLSDPACVEIITGGDDLPTSTWRRVCP